MAQTVFILWIICMTFSPIYNILGEKIIILLFLLYAFLNKKMRINKVLLVFGALFFVMYFLKLFPTFADYTPYSYYHSIQRHAIGMAELLMFFLLIDNYDIDLFFDDKNYINRVKNWILYSYHLSIIISIIFLLIKGKNLYRSSAASSNFLVAPQFFLIFSICISMALTFEAIKNRDKRVRNIVLILLNATYIVLSNYTTQMIFLLAGITIVIINTILDTKTKRIIGTVIIAFLIFGLVNYLPEIIRWIAITFFSNNGTVYMRLNELYTFLMFGDAGIDLNGRFDLINASVRTFKEHFIFGVSFLNYNTQATGIVVGDHSEWVDDLARYGIVGFTLFAAFVCCGFKSLFVKFRATKELVISYVLLIVLYGFANPILNIFVVCGLIISLCLIIDTKDKPLHIS